MGHADASRDGVACGVRREARRAHQFGGCCRLPRPNSAVRFRNLHRSASERRSSSRKGVLRDPSPGSQSLLCGSGAEGTALRVAVWADVGAASASLAALRSAAAFRQSSRDAVTVARIRYHQVRCQGVRWRNSRGNA